MGFADLFGWGKRNAAPINVQVPQFSATNAAQAHDLALAEAIYANTPSWLYEEETPIPGIGLGALIASEVARIITLECKVSVDNDEDVDAVIQRYVMPNIRVEVEKGWALGGLILKPYYTNAALQLDSENRVQGISGKLKIDFSYPSKYLITDYDRAGAIVGVKFFTTITKENKFYTLVETQKYDEQTSELVITNEVYRTPSASTKFKWDNLGSELVPVDTIEEWQNLLPRIVFPNVRGCLLGYYRPALANNKNVGMPHGASGLTRAANAIKRADITYSALDWELDASLARLYIDEVSLNEFDKMPKKLTKYIVKLLGSGDKRYFEKFSPDIREQHYLAVYDAHLRQIEDIVGLAHGTFSKAEHDNAKTAKEVIMNRQRTYAMAADNQKALETAIRQLVYAIGVWLDPATVREDYEMSFDFDDGVISNPAEQMQTMLQLQEAGNIAPYRVNMSYFNVSAEDAQRMVDEARQGVFAGMADGAEAGIE